MEIYLFKSAACLAILFFFYKLVLENTALHTTKRIYLLVSTLVSFVIPFITFTEFVEVTPIVQTFSETPSFVAIATQSMAIENMSIDYTPYILWAIYGLGVVIFSFRFARNLLSLVGKIKNNPAVKNKSIFYVLLHLPVTPHSFFNYIFFSKKAFESNEIPEEVIIHERAHVNQKHSWDLLFMELLRIVFWFNPLLYFIKSSVRLNHEFLADRAVLQSGADTSVYQNVILGFSSPDPYRDPSFISLAHSINYSSFKKRFTVMKTHTSKRAAWLKSLIILPLMAVLVYGFSSRQVIEKQAVNSNIQLQDKQVNDILQLPSLEEQIRTNTNPKKFFMHFAENKISFNGLEINIDELASKINEGTKSWAEQDFTNSKNSEIILAHNSFDFLNDTEFINKVNEQFSRTKLAEKTGGTKLLITNWNSQVLKMFTISKLEKIDAIYYWEGKKITFAELDQLLEKDNYIKLEMTHLYDNEQAKVEFSVINLSASQIKTYNKLAKKYNAQPIETRRIPLSDLQILEGIYAIMTYDQKENAQPFPECLPKDKSSSQQGFTETYNDGTARSISIKILDKNTLVVDGVQARKKDLYRALSSLHTDITKEQRDRVINIHVSAVQDIPYNDLVFIQKVATTYGYHRIVTPKEEIIRSKGNTPASESIQKKATAAQIKEYNTLAKKYNSMSKDNMRIKGKELTRMRYLYDIMTIAQRKEAEPYPNIPPPPPAPDTPRAPKIKKGDKSDIPPPPPQAPKAPKTQNLSQNGSQKESISFRDIKYAPENTMMFYLEDVVIPKDKAIKLILEDPYIHFKPATDNSNMNSDTTIYLYRTNTKREVYNPTPPPAPEVKEGEKSDIPPPPPAPPTPTDPLDQVIAMAKKGASFYYEGQPISSDKAIDLLKKNKDLNIQISNNSSKREVRISKSPIKL